MFSRHDLDKPVTVVFGNGIPAIRGTLTDYDDVNGQWAEVQGVVIGVERGSGNASRHLIPTSGIGYIRFEKEEKP